MNRMISKVSVFICVMSETDMKDIYFNDNIYINANVMMYYKFITPKSFKEPTCYFGFKYRIHSFKLNGND